MKKHFLLQILLGLLPSSTAHAQWVQTNGPGGGRVSEFAARDGKIFAATLDGGMFVTTDRGATWKGVNNGVPNHGRMPTIHALLIADSVLLSGGGSGRGICRSIDDGANWVEASSPDIVYSFAKMGEALFAASNSNGILKSTDYGLTWKNSALSGEGTLSHLGTYGPKLFAGGSGIYRSVDGGATWGNRHSTVNYSNITAIVGSGPSLIAGHRGSIPYSEYFASRDSGATWQSDALPMKTGVIWSLAAGGGRIYAGTDSGNVASSPDTALSWTHSNAGLPRRPVKALFVGRDVVLAGMDENGVFASHDKGSTWVAANHGFAASRVFRLAVIGKTLFATTVSGTYEEIFKAFRSDDYGETWERIGSSLPEKMLPWFIALNGKLYVGTMGKLFVSPDKGTSWESLEITQQDSLTGFISGFDGHLYASAKNSLWHSTDGGGSWNATSQPASKGHFQFAKTSAGLFAADKTGFGYYRSTDNGASWILVQSGMEKLKITHILAQDNFLYANTTGGVYVSGDHGKSWALKFQQPGNPMLEMIETGGSVFGCKSSLADTVGVYGTSDKGESWVGIGSGLGNKAVYSLAVAGEYLFAGILGTGVWRRPLSELGVGVQGPHTAAPQSSRFRFMVRRGAGFSLAISFTLSHPEVVKATLFDPSLKVIATLSDNYREAGAHSLTWNHGHLASGLYFVQIQVGKDRAWKSIPLVR